MLTSAGRPGDVARCRELGVVASLIKPAKHAELLEAVRNPIEREPEIEADGNRRERVLQVVAAGD